MPRLLRVSTEEVLNAKTKDIERMIRGVMAQDQETRILEVALNGSLAALFRPKDEEFNL